ncbi:MAG TPA: hypothetical protein PK812_10715 [Beijerinckiaceae bacterium]|nr:hypothetical protein [Beijerinckiaceae bacterium]
MTPRFEQIGETLRPQRPGVGRDARAQLAHLYREIGISAVAAALHAQGLASVEEREAVKRASSEIPPMLRKENLAA